MVGSTAVKLDMAVDSWIRWSVTVAITAVDMNVDTVVVVDTAVVAVDLNVIKDIIKFKIAT